MRQIFSSPRIENVEQVEKLFEEAGIATRVTDRSTWNRATKRDFSYTEKRHKQKWPAVWVLNADDYPRARVLMREVGLLETTRENTPTYAPDTDSTTAIDPQKRTVNRVRIALLVVIFALAVFAVARYSDLMPA